VEGVLDGADVRSALAELVARKQAGEEIAVAPPVEALTRFIEAELSKASRNCQNTIISIIVFRVQPKRRG